MFSSYLADSLWLSDLGSFSVGHEGMENEQQPLQLLSCLVCLVSLGLQDTQDLHHTELYIETQHRQTRDGGSPTVLDGF